MMTSDWVIEWFQPGSTSGEDLTDVVDVRAARKMKAEANGMEVTLANTFGEHIVDGNIVFPLESTFKLYARNNGLVSKTSTYLIGTYVLLNYESMPDDNKIKLILGDKTYNMLSRITVVKDDTKTTPELVENIVQQINEDGVNATPITTDIASTKSDGSAFSNVTYTTVYEDGYGAISELSQPEYTGDDLPYIFWFDEGNKFHWKYPDQTIDPQVFTYGTDPVITLKTQKQESTSISMIIYNAGEDLNGNDRVNFELDPEATSVKNKMSYQPMTDISGLVRQQIKEANGLSDTSNSTISGVISNSDFIDLLDSVAIGRCFRIFDNVGKGIWEATIDTIGQKFDIGGLHTVKAPEHGLGQRNMRLKGVIHKFNKDGWNTRLELEEDPAKID